jgi:GH24 family phage-related lysozyme (muramidase)
VNYSTSAIELTVQAETGNGVPPTGVFLNENSKPSLGYGHLVSKLDRIELPVTKHKALTYLRQDLQLVSAWLDTQVHDLSQNQFDALACLGYHALNGRVTTLDRQRFDKSRVLQLVREHKMALASAEFSRWVYNPQFDQRLVLRRGREQFLFDSP